MPGKCKVCGGGNQRRNCQPQPKPKQKRQLVIGVVNMLGTKTETKNTRTYVSFCELIIQHPGPLRACLLLGSKKRLSLPRFKKRLSLPRFSSLLSPNGEVISSSQIFFRRIAEAISHSSEATFIRSNIATIKDNGTICFRHWHSDNPCA